MKLFPLPVNTGIVRRNKTKKRKSELIKSVGRKGTIKEEGGGEKLLRKTRVLICLSLSIDVDYRRDINEQLLLLLLQPLFLTLRLCTVSFSYIH